jgi:hypothetical protein
MKAKTLTFLVVLCLALGMLAGEAFSATAQKSSGVIRMRHISEDVLMDAPGSEFYQAPRAVTKYIMGGAKLTCEDIQPEVGIIIQHDQIGDTWYEYQKNASMGRMISVTSGGYRHVSWMYTDHEYPPGPRFTDANCKDPAGAYVGQVHADGAGDEVNSGYCNQTHFHDGTSVIIHHRTAGTPVWSTTLTIDDDVCGGFFTTHWDVPDFIPGAPSGEDGMWPKAEVMYNADDGIDYIHIAMTEGNLQAGANLLAYERCYVSPTNGDTLVCQSFVSAATATYHIKNNQPGLGSFAPISHFDTSCSVSPVVAVSPVSKKVAVAYLRPACDGSCDYIEDCAYFESINNGDDWIDGTQWPPTIYQVTNFGCTGTERCFHDVAACYDYQDSLHIVYLTAGFDPEQPGYYQPGVGRLYHYSKKDGITQIHEKIQGTIEAGGHNCIVAKMSISAKDPIYHPGGDSVYLFCTWTQFDTSDRSASDYDNGDIFGSGSFDGGDTWGGIFNLTNTQTDGCSPGNCVSEHWSSLAQNMYDGDLHIEYMCDLDAGGGIMDGTQWMANPVMYLHLTEWEVTAEARGGYIIRQPSHWYHPPLKISPGGSRTLIFVVRSIGNANLIWSAGSADPCIQGSAGGTLIPGDSAVVTFTADGSGQCSGTFIDGTIDLTTNEGGGTTVNIPVQAVVADDYYECPRDPETIDTLYNGVLVLAVNANCGEAISDSGVISDTALDVFFEGGSFIATTIGSDTLVGRFMREDRHAGVRDKLYKEQCEPDWEPHFWIIYTKNIFMHNLEPPADHKWYWWEASKQIKFFKESAPEDYKRLVIKYIKVRRHDPPAWWPDQSAFTGYEDTYIGMAEDIDCPWDSSYPGDPFVGDESATNTADYDDVNHIVWQEGYGRGEHPDYSNYFCGMALATGGTGGGIIPYGAYNVKNNHYLYPQGGWGWKNEELYFLASQSGYNIEQEDSIVDRSQVLTAAKIDAGSNPDAEASYAIILAAAPNGMAQLQALIDTGRAIVAREAAKGYPVMCGDANYDGAVGAGDVVYLLSYLFRGGDPPPCPMVGRADANLDGSVGAGDIVFLLSYLFRGGPAPECPGVWGP